MVNLAKKTDIEVQRDSYGGNSPFLLENETGYQLWKTVKLERYNCHIPDRIIKIADPASLSPATLKKLADQLRTFNFAFFNIDAADAEFSTGGFLAFGRQLGLNRIDIGASAETTGVTLLSAVEPSHKRSRYIPYTNRALNWHTDGYYNPMSSRINAFSLYCVNQAGQGGDNFMMDHEMLYMQIRDTDPDSLIALMDSGAMIVPANISNKRVIRRAESGPVFIVDSETGRLGMRYSARPHNIVWKTDAVSKRAVKLVREILMDSEYIARLKLKTGQGIICNNVPHGRKAYADDSSGKPSRLYYRARYYDAVTFRQDS